LAQAQALEQACAVLVGFVHYLFIRQICPSIVQSGMVSTAAATSNAASHPVWTPSLKACGSAKTQSDSRDMVTEAAALSLARRRGQNAPSVDTKLANAWLGFYVALTKSASRPSEAATQASTDATEASLSEVASSDELSPVRVGSSDCDLVTSTRSSIQSWADVDASEDEQDDEEVSDKKRSRRSHRRRRNRRRGKGGSKKGNVEMSSEDRFESIVEEEDDASAGSAIVTSVHEEARALVSTAPSPPCHVPVGPWSATHRAEDASRQGLLPTAAMATPASILGRSPMGMLSSTSPTAGQSPVCDASARTPVPGMGQFGCSSPVMQMGPSNPAFFGPTEFAMATPGHEAYQGQGTNALALALPLPAVYSFAPGQNQAGPTMYMFAGSSGHGQAMPPVPAPSTTAAFVSAQQGPSPPLPPFSSATAPWSATPLMTWLMGGLVTTSESDLKMILQASAPEVYED